ncbi:hypothetical protein IK3_05611 [Bacillus toyonensis]|nr:hypothetical protein IK3_05611 [Bacillus toyonensis]
MFFESISKYVNLKVSEDFPLKTKDEFSQEDSKVPTKSLTIDEREPITQI